MVSSLQISAKSRKQCIDICEVFIIIKKKIIKNKKKGEGGKCLKCLCVLQSTGTFKYKSLKSRERGREKWKEVSMLVSDVLFLFVESLRAYL